MKISIHQFKATISALTESDLTELIQILGVDRRYWKQKKHSRTGEVVSYQYTFPGVKESAFIRMGVRQPDRYIDPQTRVVYQANPQFVPAGLESYFSGASILLHGSWFDHSKFDFGRLLEFLNRTGYSPSELDVAYDDDQRVTTLDQWLEVFTNWKEYCLGNMLKKSQVLIVRNGTAFERVQLSRPTSSNYATLYQRDGVTRLELKMRESRQIKPLLCQYDDNLPAEFIALCASVLISNLNIVEPQTKATRNKTKYKRVTFWNAFLDCMPVPVKWSEVQEQKRGYDRALDSSFSTDLKTILGRVHSFLGRYANHKKPEEIKTLIKVAIENM